MLCKTKNDHWRNWLEEITEKDIWTANKYISQPFTDGSASRIPTLVKRNDNGDILLEACSNAQKSQILSEVFFPKKPQSLPDHPMDTTPCPPLLPLTPPTLQQLERQVKRTGPHKVPGPDGIPNIVLHKVFHIIGQRLLDILISSLQLSYFPAAWRTWATIVLKKPGRADYSIPKSYCPIALYNTMGKALSAVISEQMVYLIQKHELLPSRQFGGLPGKSTSNSLLYLTQKIKDAWRQKKVVTIMFLDIANALPNAVTERLLKNMRRLGLPTEIVNFIEAKLTDRFTTLSFDRFTSDPIHIDNGIGQGDTDSMILYAIYNHPLIEVPKGKNEDGGGFVDDTFYMATANTFDECDSIIDNMLSGQEEWSKSHNSPAERSKFACLRLTRKRTLDRKDYIRDGTTIKCVKSAKLLGVQIDQELR